MAQREHQVGMAQRANQVGNGSEGKPGRGGSEVKPGRELLRELTGKGVIPGAAHRLRAGN